MTDRFDWEKADKSDRVREQGSERAFSQIIYPIDWAARRRREARDAPRNVLRHSSSLKATLTQEQRTRLKRFGLSGRDLHLREEAAQFVLEMLEPITVDLRQIDRALSHCDAKVREQRLIELRALLRQGLIGSLTRLDDAAGTVDDALLKRTRGMIGRAVKVMLERLPSV